MNGIAAQIAADPQFDRIMPDNRCRNWAETGPTWFASVRTGVRAVAAVRLEREI
jgi:hypothetical protein